MSSETQTYRVEGMSCEHCVRAVTEEVSQIESVRGVEVDLADGSVTVTADPAVDDAAVRAAIVEAGYEVVP